METKVCKVCGRELPETSFRKVKGGGYGNTCKECCSEALKEAAYQRKTEGGGVNPLPFTTRTSTAKNRARSLTQWYAAANGLKVAASR